MIDIFLYLTYFLVLASLLLAVGFALWFLVKNFRKAKSTIFGAIGLVIIFIVAYLLSSSEIYEKYDISSSVSQFIGGSLIMLYIMFFGTFAAAIYAEISKFFK